MKNIKKTGFYMRGDMANYMACTFECRHMVSYTCVMWHTYDIHLANVIDETRLRGR